MENKKKKCSFKEHKDIDAIYYCQECKIFMCNKCINHHQGLFENHNINNLDKDDNEIFIDICKEINHPIKLQYFCKNHNKLCCAACISKLEGKGNGQHKDCDICFIENIKEEKKNKLDENIKILEDLTNNLENSIKELKTILEKLNERKEEIKEKIQKTFTKIRNILNEREDELLLEVDNKYKDLFFNDDIIKESEKLPNKIKTSLEKGKIINNEWDNSYKLSSLINDCINIEENIKYINLINSNIKQCKLNNDIKIEFISEDEYSNDFIQTIKKFGFISNTSIDSLILKNKEDLINFYKLISNHIKIYNINLLYRSSENGLNFSNIVNKINNKSNLIFLFFTGNKRIFGVFIKSKLENIENLKYFRDENSFVFSLNNNKIYNIINAEKAIKFSYEYKIKIGNTDVGNGIYFQYNTDIIDDSGLLKTPKIYNFLKNYELTESSNKLTELEIFEINKF